ncbi:MAG: L,D-transpeptidase family protein [Desulfobacterales bacterium]|nr:L,D-transpeptidase family protein [Desulfobacterales bacterium]
MNWFCRKSALVWMAPIILAAGLLAVGPAGAATGETVATVLREVLQSSADVRNLWVGCERIHAGEDLVAFYRERAFAPVWLQAGGPSSQARDFALVLADAGRHGLIPGEYHYDCIRDWLTHFRRGDQALPSGYALAGFDIVMTDAFITFASHLVGGKVDPQTIYPQWVARKRSLAVLDVLAELDTHGSIERLLATLAPVHPDYRRQVAAAEELRRIAAAGGWPGLHPAKTLRRDDNDPEVRKLRERLAISGDLRDRSQPEAYFDAGLEVAVARFQRRHGLAADGVVGPATLRALNVPADQRLAQLLLNLERWRWIPHDLGQRYILVNAADFSLIAVEEGVLRLAMRVIVGEAYQKTPVFSREMRYLEINPYWNVPDSIALEEFLPKIRRNPGFIAANNYQLLSGWSPDSVVIDPASVNWSAVRAGRFPGRLRQLPGPWNALGQIKFMFPNPFNVYLHDTPGRSLFNRQQRALSHGCIRVEKPLELAVFVLEGTPGWDLAAVRAAVDDGARQTVRPVKDCMVHLLYWTAWVDADGTVNFREDIYERDEVLWAALNRQPIDRGGDAPVLRLSDATDWGLAAELPTRSEPARHPRE